MGVVIGLDIGTSAVKAVLVDADQHLLAAASAPLTSQSEQPAWSEQQPDAWWQATLTVLAELQAAAPSAYAATAALGLSGQMHGLVALAADHRPIRPAMLWNDARARRQCDELAAAVPDLGTIAGVIAMPGFSAPKLLWLNQNEPENYARIRHLVLPKDYVRLHLTGETVTDMADAAGTLWLDQAARHWSVAIAGASCADMAWLPRLVEGNAVGGQLRPSVATELGLTPGIPVAGGAGDAAAGGIGIGFIAPGDAYLSLGTSAQMFVTTDAYRPAPSTLVHAFAHGLPKRWFQMAAMLNGASPLEAMSRIVGQSDISALLDRVAARIQGPGKLLFLPYLAGERTPHNNADARGVLFGLDGNSSTEDVIQAVLEGVAYTLADAQECLAKAGTSISRLGVVGGGARSALWMQIIADVLGIPLERYDGSDKGPAFGAARLAQMALYAAAPETIANKPALLDCFAPRREHQAGHARNLLRFRRLYQALRPEFALAQSS